MKNIIKFLRRRLDLSPWFLLLLLFVVGVVFLNGYLLGSGGRPLEYGVDALRSLSRHYAPGIYERVSGWIGAGGDSAPPGRWEPVPGQDSSSTSKRSKIQELKGIGYLSGTQEATAQQGVIVHNASRVSPGYNLYCSGHGPEAYLISNRGELLHKWKLPWSETFPDLERPWISETDHFWRKVHVYPNGDLLAIFEGIGIIRVDRNSNLLWARKNMAHHDMWVGDGGRIYVLTRKAHVVPSYNPDEPILEDYVSVLGPDGETRKRLSLLKSFQRSNYASMLHRLSREGDIFHTNTLEILDASSASGPPFTEGRALISLRNGGIVALVDLQQNRVVWAVSGFFRGQHDPHLLPNRNILLFDNWGHRGASRVLEFDPYTQKIEWVYDAEPPENFFSNCCGTSQRLPNGNTLITSSEKGRVLELSPNKELVWEFLSPHRAGKKNQLVATLFEMKRLPPDFPLDWTDHPPSSSRESPQEP